jgi:hypothetical protein
MLDLRLPSGCFFAITGVLLTIYGLAVPGNAPLTDASVNVNLYVGVIMMAFGNILLYLARRGRKT